MAAEKTSPDFVRIENVKHLDPSLTLKKNREQLKAVTTALQNIVRNEELQGGLVVQLPLSDGQVHELTVSHTTREGLPESEQAEMLFWSDYAAIMLDLAQKFKKTAARDDFLEYDTTSRELQSWSTTAGDVLDEIDIWNKRYELGTLLKKLSGAFSAGITEEEPTDETDEDKESPYTDTSTKEPSDAEKAAKVLAALEEQRAAQAAVVPQTASEAIPESPQDQPAQLDPTRPAQQQLSKEFFDLYQKQLNAVTIYTLGQIARDQNISYGELPPELYDQVRAFAQDFLQNEGDLAALLVAGPMARRKAIEKFSSYLQQKGILVGAYQEPQKILEEKLHEILGEENPIIDKNVEKTLESIVKLTGDNAIQTIEALEKGQVQIIFGLEKYPLTDTQVAELKKSLIDYVQTRIVDLELYTQSEKIREGLDPEKAEAPTTQQLVTQISTVRETISRHSKDDDEKAELLAGAMVSTGDSTSKKITFALGQNEKIFGNYWRSLSPEQQAVALAALGSGYLVKGDKHPVEGYELPINIFELDPNIFKKHAKSLTEQAQTFEAYELEIAQEVLAYNHAKEREVVYAMNLKAAYLAQVEETILASLATQIQLEEASLRDIMMAEYALRANTVGESGGSGISGSSAPSAPA